MGREFELKYSATPEQQAAIRELFPDLTSTKMETTYYDTPTGALSARRWTLRRRFENGRSVCTVKTPAPGGARGEWELEAEEITAAIPELCKLGAPEELIFLTADGVIRVCGAGFTRLAGEIAASGCTLELALDSGVLMGGGMTAPLCEVEVELKSGDEAAAVAYARELAQRFGLVPQPKSKYRRALELARTKE